MDNGLFTGTAEFYSKFRPQIPSEVVNHIKERFSLDETGTLLDLGCGVGQSTYAIAPLLERTVAIDPDPDMLKMARKNCPLGLNIDWQNKSDADVTTKDGPYRLVISSRSFHWMEQDILLPKLLKIIEENGGIAVIGDGSFWTGEDEWQKEIKKVIAEFLGEQRKAGHTGKNFATSEEPYTDMLARAGFVDIQKKSVSLTRDWKIQDIIGCLYSTSFAAPHLFGDRKDEFENRLAERLNDINNQKEIFRETASFDVQSAFVPRRTG